MSEEHSVDYKFKSHELKAIKEAADPQLVANAVNMEVQQYSGKRISVLCPGHDDHHHGSCFLTPAGCRCYVCNRDFDVFDMVRLQLNVSFYKAVLFVADLCGGRERFISRGTQAENAISIVSNADLNLLGLHNTPVYVLREIVPAFAEPERMTGFRHTWYPADPKKEEEDYVVIEECVCRNPLQELRATEPAEYMRLIRDKALEELEHYKELQKEAYRYSRSEYRELNKPIRRLEELFIEHGGSLRNVRAGV